MKQEIKRTAENIQKEYELIKTYLNEVILKKEFFIPFVLSVMLSFSFTIFNRTLFIDDLLQDFYYGPFNRKLKALRWGQYFVDKVFSTAIYTPFINRFMGVLFLVLTIMVIGTIFYYFDKKKNEIWKYTLLSCMFISYPMICEFMGYFEALTIPFDFFLVSVVALYHLLTEKHNLPDLLLEGFVLSFVMTGYESLIIAYISEVFVILYLKYVVRGDDNKISDWLKDGFSYAIPLFIAFGLKYVIGYLILFVTGFERGSDGDTTIYWLSSGLYSAGMKVTLYNFFYYIIRGLSYFPVAVFALASFIFVIMIIRRQKRGNSSILIGILLYISMFGLSILQGSFLMYRQCQPQYVFICLVIYLLYEDLENKKWLKRVFIIFMLFVSLRQSVYTHTMLALDNQRSNNELAIVHDIGYRLYSRFDHKKEIIFCGKNDLGDYINRQITVPQDSIERKFFDLIGIPFEEDNDVFTDTVVKSVINWAIRAFEKQDTMEKLFSYCGYDIHVRDMYFDRNTNKEYEKIALANDMKPIEIRDMGDYILVYFGKVDS